jgi:hypothetical protein
LGVQQLRDARPPMVFRGLYPVMVLLGIAVGVLRLRT